MPVRPIIDPEIAALLPPLTPEELTELEKSLRGKDGCRDELVVWAETGILLDGYNRLAICEKYSISYFTHHLKFPSRAAAIQWVIDNQLGRRNLTDERRAYYRGKEYLNQKQAHGGQVPGGSAQNEHSLDKGAKTAEVIAAKHGVAPATVRRDAEFAQAVDEIGAMDAKAREDILSGRSGTTKTAFMAARRTALAAKRPKKPKAGCEKFAWAVFQQLYGRLVRGLDEIAKAYNSRNSHEHRSSLQTMSGFLEIVQAWRAKLEANQQE